MLNTYIVCIIPTTHWTATRVRYLNPQPNQKPMKITPSMLSTYLYCPRKVFLNYVLKLREPPKKSLVKGTVRHETYDNINKTEEKLVTSIKQKLDRNQLSLLYKTHYSKLLRNAVLNNKDSIKSVNLTPSQLFELTLPYIIQESQSKASNLFSFIEKHNLFGKELWKALTPKIQSEIKIQSDALNLKGIVDQVEIYDKGIVPIELKTGKMPRQGVWPGHKIQLGAYVLLLEEHFKTQIKEGFIVYLDSQQRRQIIVNPFLRQEVMDLIKKVGSILSSTDLPNHIENMNKCNPCGLKNECYNGQFMKEKMEDLLVINQKL